MSPDFLSQPPKRSAPVDELIIDFVLGCCASMVLFFLAFSGFAMSARSAAGVPGTLFLCGIFLAIPLAYFALGNLRGGSEGNLWLKAFFICGLILMIGPSIRNLFWVIAGITFPATVLGLWLRRRGFSLLRLSKKPNQK